MKKHVVLLIPFFLLLTSLVSSLGINISKEGVASLPDGAVHVDKHRYFFVEEYELIDKGKKDQLRLTVRVGSDYNISGNISISNYWQIGRDTRYFFEIRDHNQKKYKSISQFNITPTLDGTRNMTIEIRFTIPKEFNLSEAKLFFTGKPDRITKTKGAPILPPQQEEENAS
ncbi:hypothetical protein [Entomospira culicis]|uniref:Uncharacterized protein n=1 Tax=Entomospira culicis TaxID=2719989 RepID=A0A968KUH3_9SPIO|nr:hypothetical protein [Entomospira culicis]NIZ18910.1 hypothetical protein [Entomospira culicis]NIZ69125.1 hypothetical protein [Entomospira culicis]WDI37711.1 hypothetical protein PVA46_02705 [Entomospira culicis]WDI39339.1 hypothetical protein PVA47_02710 [Entomospira culicis]